MSSTLANFFGSATVVTLISFNFLQERSRRDFTSGRVLSETCSVIALQQGGDLRKLVLRHFVGDEIGGGKAAGAVAAAMGEEEAEGVEEAAQGGFDGGAGVEPGAIE